MPRPRRQDSRRRARVDGRRGALTARSSTGSGSARPSSRPADRLQGAGPGCRREVRRRTFQQQLADANNELNLDDAAKIVGCWNGLAKRIGTVADGDDFAAPTPRPMRRAVAFARDIKALQEARRRSSPRVDRRLRATPTSDAAALRGRPRRRHLQRPRAQHAARLAQGRRCPTTRAASSPTPAACPRASTSPPSTRCCSSTRATRVVDVVQSVGPRHAPAPRASSTATSSCPSASRPAWRPRRRWATTSGTRCLAGPAGPARPRRPLQRHGQPARAEQEAADIDPRRQRSARRRRGRSTAELRPAPTSDTEHRRAAQMASSWRCSPSTTGATRSTPRSSTRSAPAATGRTGPRTSPTSPPATPTRIHALLDGRDPAITSAFDALPARPAGQPQRRHHRDDAIDMLAQHLITKPVFDALFEDYDFAGHNPVPG